MATALAKGTRWWAMLALLAALILGMAACGQGGEDEESKVPQVFRARIAGDPETLDPQKGGFATDISIMRQLFRGVVAFDENLNVVAAAAAEVPSVENAGISDDGLTYSFELRDGLMWSDGSPLTAYDWEYSLKRFFDPTLGGNQYYQTLYYDIEGAMEYHMALGTPDEPRTPAESELVSLREAVSVDAVDEDTLQIKLLDESNTFLYLMALWPGYPVKNEAITSGGDAWIEAGNLVSNGPFMLTEWAHDQRLVLERNPYYWGPKPGLERLELGLLRIRVRGNTGVESAVGLAPDRRAGPFAHNVAEPHNGPIDFAARHGCFSSRNVYRRASIRLCLIAQAMYLQSSSVVWGKMGRLITCRQARAAIGQSAVASL